MSNKMVSVTVALGCILGSVIFLLPFPTKLINIIIYLSVVFPAGVFMVRSGSGANSQKDKAMADLRSERAKL